jgi:hypothetical protein
LYLILIILLNFQIENENPHQATANIQKLKQDLELVKNEQLILLKKLKVDP